MAGDPTRPLDDLIAAVEARTPGASSLERLGAAVGYAEDLAELADDLVGHFISRPRRRRVLDSDRDGSRCFRPGENGACRRRGRFARFSPQAQPVLGDADKIARRLRHDVIGTEHLLLAIIDQKRAVATRALDAVGVPSRTVRERIEARHPAGETDAEGEGHIPFSEPAKRVLELAPREALKRGHNYVGTEHIMLALLIEPDGLAGQILRDLGVDYDHLRGKQIELIRQYGYS